MRGLTRDEAVLLRKLYQGRCFGGAHLLKANLLHGTPRDRVDDLKRALRILRREGILQTKATAHGPAVSIPRGSPGTSTRNSGSTTRTSSLPGERVGPPSGRSGCPWRLASSSPAPPRDRHREGVVPPQRT